MEPTNFLGLFTYEYFFPQVNILLIFLMVYYFHFERWSISVYSTLCHKTVIMKTHCQDEEMTLWKKILSLNPEDLSLETQHE